MRILFIGGTGNISADCAALLAERGHEIAVISRGRAAVPSSYHHLQADRKDPAALRAALNAAQPEAIINFLGFELEDVQLDYELFPASARQYLFISSATVYAKPPAALPITEDAPLGNPWWDYAQKKLACEQWLLERYHESGFPVIVVRPSHTYSHRWIPSPVSSSTYNFAARIEQGKPVFVPDQGQNPWTLTASSDFAIGLAGLVGNPAAIGQAFHITSDEVLTWNQIIKEIARALAQCAGAPREPDILKIPTDFICKIAPRLTGTLKGDKALPGVFDNSKIKRLVPEFGCTKPFAQGIRESIEWLRSDRARQILDPKVEATIQDVISAWQREGR
ncbi:MAG TPA: NAD-dependent epimerase/dehydratase family protein [Verrucomicrobiae bacterium]|nr:NAD-dependent epimerase/dehydratase family protein [Verrucomicrobiae bacterium]